MFYFYVVYLVRREYRVFGCEVVYSGLSVFADEIGSCFCSQPDVACIVGFYGAYHFGVEKKVGGVGAVVARYFYYVTTEIAASEIVGAVQPYGPAVCPYPYPAAKVFCCAVELRAVYAAVVLVGEAGEFAVCVVALVFERDDVVVVVYET